MSDTIESLQRKVAALQAENERLRTWQASHTCTPAGRSCTCTVTTTTTTSTPCPVHGITVTYFQPAPGCAGAVNTYNVNTAVNTAPIQLPPGALTSGAAPQPGGWIWSGHIGTADGGHT